MPAYKVFISSTFEDLIKTGYRAEAKKGAENAGFFPEGTEWSWESRDDKQPLGLCLQKVRECEVVVAIIGHRYGWIPADQAPGGRKSITWLECEEARANKIEVLAFFVDTDDVKKLGDKAQFDPESATDEKLQDVKDRIRLQNQFRAWIGGQGSQPRVEDGADLRARVVNALNKWIIRNHPGAAVAKPSDPEAYLAWLDGECARIKIEGIQKGKQDALTFDIERIYIPLSTTGAGHGAGRGKEDRELASKPVPLQQVLRDGCRVVVEGDPGGGKTTFLRRLAHALCRTQRGVDPEAAGKFLGRTAFPLFLKAGDLARHMQTHSKAMASDSPHWLCHYMAQQSTERGWNLDAAFFRQRLENGPCLLMVDALDEAPDHKSREALARMLEQAAVAFHKTGIVVTTRPYAYVGTAVLSKERGFDSVQLGGLERESQVNFLDAWSREYRWDSETEAKTFREKLMDAIDTRAEIAEMAANPLRLTGLAVLQANKRDLPERRAELYEWIVYWMAGRKTERVSERSRLDRLGELALRMHTHPEGRQTEVATRWSAEELVKAGFFTGAPGKSPFEQAMEFLESEPNDSGIVVEDGKQVRYWHPTFQEFLCAERIKRKVDAEQYKLLLDTNRAYQPEWREVTLLLAGLLFQEGEDKVQGLVTEMLNRLGDKPKLEEEARLVGLVGAMVRDVAVPGFAVRDTRYRQAKQRVMSIYEDGPAQQIDIKIRIAAADALGALPEKDPWVLVPAGPFWMGAQKTNPKAPGFDEEADDDEAPFRQETIARPFHIGRYPVTVAEFERFIQAGGYAAEKFWKAGGFGTRTTPEGWARQKPFATRPVVGVSWFEAAAYCAWAKCRLPTEKEWERAARGTEGWRYPWGNDPIDTTRANYNASKVGHPTPVGLYPRGASLEGVADLSGNVWEWCDGWYAKGRRPVRGGSYDVVAWVLRAANRYRYLPGYRYAFLGFRCVRE